eukprot:TRINITY_DN25730_c0_g1_i2.p1 TRINITY_DN25730_c0_g1~~TRINITY_DN25730_c0_g1_i2.p1  ORF type:complete len:189 (-),score=44.96 TRINITY_DN25730_c0_g1_i2:103-669(-)
MHARITLPGRYVQELNVVSSNPHEEPRLSVGGLVDAAAERRRALEEALFWNAWTSVVPDGASLLHRDELPKLMESGGPILQASSEQLVAQSLASGGGSGSGPSRAFGVEDGTSLPNQLSYEDVRSRLLGSHRRQKKDGVARASTGARSSTAKMSPVAAEKWIRCSLPLNAMEVTLRMPPPPEMTDADR